MNQEFYKYGYQFEKNLIPHFVLEEIKDWWLNTPVDFDQMAQDQKFVANSYQARDTKQCQLLDYLYEYLTPRIESIVAVPLVPTYNQGRIYLRGSDMKEHVDRVPCDISVTFTICNEGENWPLKLIDKLGAEKSIKTYPGDVLIYSGCDVKHWRDTNDVNDFQLQHFFHWYSPHTRDGSFFNEFSLEERSDGRKWPGALNTMAKNDDLPLPRRKNV